MGKTQKPLETRYN